MAKKAIIIGASSGIGRTLAVELVRKGWQVGVTARRIDRLEVLADEFPGQIVAKQMDVCLTTEALETQALLIDEMGGEIDLIIINAGVGEVNPELDLSEDLAMIDTNARAFAVLSAAVCKYFESQGHGHLVGITSIASERAGPGVAYNASKAFAAQYLEGLRLRSIGRKTNVHVTDIRPGFVDTDMIDKRRAFWVAPVEKAARQIVRAIEKRKRVAYITKRWRLISWVFRLSPERIYARMLYGRNT